MKNPALFKIQNIIFLAVIPFSFPALKFLIIFYTFFLRIIFLNKFVVKFIYNKN